MEEEWIPAIPNGRTTKKKIERNRSIFLIEDLFTLLVKANS
ncbi:hypothetical protein QFZ31_001289 [Neobacillus niacini]|nr:hypothetical protein [Neobacillus niacini]MDQ0971411.1 hypothetical protein [Neobacillus niacini]